MNGKIYRNTEVIFVSSTGKNKNYKLKQNRYSKNVKSKTNNTRQSYDKITKKKGRGNQPKQVKKPSVKISFLGGLNEIGKNITLIECENDIVIVDCGMAFPDGDMLGVDLVIPDFTYIEQNFEKVRGIVLTHGHEDHIGGLPFLLSRVNVPIYGTPLTLGLVGNKLREHSLFNKTQLNEVKAGSTIKLGCMSIKFIHVNHSIPDSVAFAIDTPAGTIVHTGDFKIDCTPITGEMIDLSSIARVGDSGVLALLAESTNAMRAGYTPTEMLVSESLDNLFKKAEKYRIIIATFASIDMLDKYPPEQIVLVTTGSQGEPMSALSRMAYSDHRKVMVGEGDFIIISANPIPGNEKTVGNVVDELLKRGCKVIYEGMYDVHVSGHACREELKIIHRLVKPKYFIPVHGEHKHLRKHAELAEFLGMAKSNIFIPDVGTTVEINEDQMKEAASVPAGKVFVDGLGVGDVGSIVLRDRKHLGQDGLIIIVASLDVYDGHVISGPDIVSRGFVYVRENEGLIDEVKKLALDILEDCAEKNIHEWGIIKNRIKDEISKLIAQKTRRAPMILPILQEV